MALNPLTNPAITQSVISDANYLRSFLAWSQARYSAYSLLCTTAAMNAAGISANDQTFILAFIGDLNRINQLSTGTIPGNTDLFNYNITQLLGLS